MPSMAATRTPGLAPHALACACVLAAACTTEFPDLVPAGSGNGSGASSSASVSSGGSGGGGAGATGGGGAGGSAPCVVADGGAGQRYQTTVACDGPIAYWRMDDETLAKAADQTPSGLDGVYTQTDVVLGVDGIVEGKSVRFQGDEGEMAVADVLDFTGQASFSIELWMKPEVLPAVGSTLGVLAKQVQDGDGDQGYWLTIDADARLRFSRLRDDIQDAVTSGALDLEVFTHVVVTFDGDASRLRLYLDGMEVDEKESLQSLSDNPGVLTVGSFGGWGAYRGLVDEVAIYDRPLSHLEIVTHNDAGLGR
jgi:hypothetical protein